MGTCSHTCISRKSDSLNPGPDLDESVASNMTREIRQRLDKLDKRVIM